MTPAQSRMTQTGIWKTGSTPPSTSASVKAPMNFWPSLDPCENAMNADENTCAHRKRPRTFPGTAFRNSQKIAVITTSPPRNPRKVEKIRPSATFFQPSATRASGPAVANPAPARPATNACVSLVGIPQRAATVDQTMMPTIAPADGRQVHQLRVDDSLADRRGDGGPREARRRG